MAFAPHSPMHRVVYFLSALLLAFCLAETTSAQDKDQGPIAYFGHGEMFGPDGKRIVPTPAFMRRAQKAYRDQLLGRANDSQKRQFRQLQRKLTKQGQLEGQARLVVESRLLDWLIENVGAEDDPIRGKSAIMKQVLQRQLPTSARTPSTKLPKPFTLPTDVQRLLDEEDLSSKTGAKRRTTTADAGRASRTARLTTKAKGQDYIDECRDNGVPIPPDWGTAAWTHQGRITNDFLGSPGDVYTFESSSPRGMCIALPRNDGTTIGLLGIICLGQESSKACFWDNQKNKSGFPIPVGDVVPLSEFAGGAALNNGSGGTCTDCHAGENPYVIHPNTALGLPDLAGLPLFPDDWYDPIVHKSWPQNPGPIAAAGGCAGCHVEGGPGGRFPEASTDLRGYCGIVRTAVGILQNPPPTMPPGSPGSSIGNINNPDDDDAGVKDLLERCSKRPYGGSCSSDNQCLSPTICKGKPFGKCIVEASVEIGESCVKNAECTTNQCDKGKCVCRNDDDCDGNAYCDKGTLTIGKNSCKLKKANEEGCSRDNQCLSDRCRLGKCKPQDECSDDNECGGNEFCDKGTAGIGVNYCEAKRPNEEGCTRAGQCLSDRCRLGKCKPQDECSDDNECGGNEFCNTGTVGIGVNMCEAKRPNEEGCSRDGQCQSDRCRLGKCKAQDACDNDNECDNNQFCDKGTAGIGVNKCVSKKSNGTACSRGGQCSSNCCKLYKFKIQCRPTDKCN